MSLPDVYTREEWPVCNAVNLDHSRLFCEMSGSWGDDTSLLHMPEKQFIVGQRAKT